MWEAYGSWAKVVSSGGEDRSFKWKIEFRISLFQFTHVVGVVLVKLWGPMLHYSWAVKSVGAEPYRAELLRTCCKSTYVCKAVHFAHFVNNFLLGGVVGHIHGLRLPTAMINAGTKGKEITMTIVRGCGWQGASLASVF